MSKSNDDKKKKKDQSWLEAQVLMFLQHSFKEALELALDEIEKQFK